MAKLGRCAFLVCLMVSGANEAAATDLVFQNGQELRDVRIVARTADSLSVQLANGVIRYPISAIRSIDGQPVGQEAAVPAEPQPAPTGDSAPSAAAPLPPVVATPAPGHPSPVEGPAPDRWNFVIFLAGFLLVGALWMRGLQEMQRDLYERRAEPRYWMTAALLIPVLGAGAYFLSRFAEAKMREVRLARSVRKTASGEAKDAELSPGSEGSGLSFPFSLPKKFDPAVHVARKGKPRKGLAFLDADRKSIAKPQDGELVSGLDHAGELLEEALLEQASDVHIEPASDVYRVRFRLDGILHERMTYSSTEGVRVVTALKSMAGIDIAEKRKAQDGKFRVAFDGREIDFRVATASSIYGEKMVIRVLDQRKGIFDLTSLGMTSEMIAQFQRVINSRNGMILATGPTGSGKTSTLYAALRQLDGSSLNIMTIEDPVEYELPGATQIAVNARANITYEAGLRSILRQDPDVILVGEMRDAEATGTALRAALTGHLVFSSLHTKDAIGTVSRLQDMGIERYQVASALLMVLAQRLVRVLCRDCRRKYPAVGDELAAIGLKFDPGVTLYAAEGCDACHGTGFRGRTGIFELLVLDEEFRRAFGEGQDESMLARLAVERGFRNYRYDGAEKALKGITTVEEVLRAS